MTTHRERADKWRTTDWSRPNCDITHETGANSSVVAYWRRVLRAGPPAKQGKRGRKGPTLWTTEKLAELRGLSAKDIRQRLQCTRQRAHQLLAMIRTNNEA